MSVQLDYPDSTTPTDSVTLPDPITPYEGRRIQKFNVTQMTDGGTDYVYDKGITKYIYPMNFVITSPSVIDDLRDFFDNTTNGQEETFAMNDPFGTEYTVRFNQSVLNIVEHKKNGVYEVTLEFKSA